MKPMHFAFLGYFCSIFIDLKWQIHVFKAIEDNHDLYFIKIHQEWMDAAMNDWMYFSLMPSKSSHRHEIHAFRIFNLFLLLLKLQINVFKAIETYHALNLMKFHQEWVNAAKNDFSLMPSNAAFRFFAHFCLFSMIQNGRYMFSGSQNTSIHFIS